ncbi:DUF1513 domain-containing protein [Roseibium litorale]|uniref:DUF1513 domain-containing protein n=1 Tax=Roseibium litorale TaxID=2803841 RepID=A0ABR9CM12_9HYPH|nr:DUF1513 domain-containing protein [Roseibium litorale]MBD8891699.1 DUF1513 domain-containing protein [Roseibium litorale]
MLWTATKKTAINRRSFLAGLGGAAVLAGSGWHGPALAEGLIGEIEAPLFATACKRANGSYALAILDDAGQMLAEVGLPDRGHGMAVSPDGRRIMAFARRPGTFAMLIDPYDRKEPLVIASEPGRHFYGHGCFSADGRLVYAVENDYERVRGVLGVYDVSGRDVRRIGEIETGGIGPHDLLRMPDGKTMVVANGGIQTDPGQPREKLNIETMDPSVVYLDLSSGDVLAQHRLSKDLHKLSLRHMALDGKGQVWVGGQFEGDLQQIPPLVAHMTQDTSPILTDIPEQLASGLQSYIGSVVANRTGDVVATSAPRGGQVMFWSASTGALLGSKAVIDGCGIAPVDGSAFLISDGLGGLRYLGEPDAVPDVLAQVPGMSFDNHMFAL